MGSVTSGIPQAIVQRLVALSGAKTFIETGTFQGGTARWAATVFDTVHTIELAQALYEQHHAALEEIPGVRPHLGDSAEIMPRIVSELPAETPALFWLDGHWSGGETAGEQQECPLMTELECLRNRPHDLILIDDARLFLCAPPEPHKPEQWPTIAEICHLFDSDRYVQVIHDVIYVVPNQPALRQALIEFARSSAAPLSGPKGMRHLAGKLLGK